MDHDGEAAASRGDVCRHVSRAEPRRLQPLQGWFTFVEVPGAAFCLPPSIFC